jgi:hypothetical protein
VGEGTVVARPPAPTALRQESDMGHRRIVVLLSSSLFVAGCSADAGQVGLAPERVSRSRAGLVTGSDRFTTPLPGDFNGDGIDDLIIATGSGSYEYTGLKGGGFTANVWTDPNLPGQENTFYVGDFNGDHIADLIIQTHSGAYEYLGKKTGGFVANAWTHGADWSIDFAAFVVSDFNGDGVSDFIVSTGSASSEYLGVKTSGLYTGPVWTISDFTDYGPKTGNLYPGDFNGDNVGDFIATDGSGSYEYLGVKGSGGFTGPAWTRADLPFTTTEYSPGDYNGDGVTDLIIVDKLGSWEYFGQKTGGFTAGTWHSSNWTLGNVRYQPGDYNNDGKTDLMIANSSASFVYLGLAGGGFQANAWKSPNYNLGNMFEGGFTRGDFNGDGFADVIITSTAGSYEYTGEQFGYHMPALVGPVWTRTDLTAGNAYFF